MLGSKTITYEPRQKVWARDPKGEWKAGRIVRREAVLSGPAWRVSVYQPTPSYGSVYGVYRHDQLQPRYDGQEAPRKD